MPQGRLTALVGTNGGGESTLRRLIGQLKPLQQGRISVAGHDVATTPTAELARSMAILSQQIAIASRLRVAELVGLGRWPHHRGRPRTEDRAKVTALLKAFSVTPLADRVLDEISGGQAKRAHFAKSFAQYTSWLLLDEPLNNLDMAHAPQRLMVRVSGLVRDLDRSAAMFVHEVNYAAARTDHIIAKDGRMLAEGNPEDVLTEAVLSDLYDVTIRLGRHGDRPLVLHHV